MTFFTVSSAPCRRKLLSENDGRAGPVERYIRTKRAGLDRPYHVFERLIGFLAGGRLAIAAGQACDKYHRPVGTELARLFDQPVERVQLGGILVDRHQRRERTALP